MTTLADQAYQLIRRQVMHGELPAGAIISERMLAERLELGKAPIRNAVQRLATEGFISVEPQRGIVISPLSIQDVLDLYEIRVVLEQLVVRRITGNLKSEQIDQLHANLEHHRAIAGESAPAMTLSVDFDFHRLLCDFYGNGHLNAMLNRVYDSIFPELRLSHEKAPGRVLEAVNEHQALAEAIVQGDAGEAERLITAHLSCCQEFLLYRGARGQIPPSGASTYGLLSQSLEVGVSRQNVDGRS